MIKNQSALLANAEFRINGAARTCSKRQAALHRRGRGEKDAVLAARGGSRTHRARVASDPGLGANQLVHALDRILAYRTPLKLLPIVEEFLHDVHL